MTDEWRQSSWLFGNNACFIEQRYEEWLADPAAVAPAWRERFDALRRAGAPVDIAHTPIRTTFAELVRQPPEQRTGIEPGQLAARQVAVLQFIEAYRYLGYQHADLDPLGRINQRPVPELDPAFYGFTDRDMETVWHAGALAGAERATLGEIHRILKQTYCGAMGIEYMHMTDSVHKRWIQARIEPIRASRLPPADERRFLLERLVAAETLEKYLHTRYVGQKRFSLQGGESLIPLLDTLVQHAGTAGIEEVVIGMAHRGRLNVLVNILGKRPADLFREFEGVAVGALTNGDVKYHQGFSADIGTPGGPVHIALAFNPSHLEIVDPVVEGSVRARQQRRNDTAGDRVLPVLVHGDAAFSGQGVVMETLNMSQMRGYATGGTVHIIINNQIGFTTSDPRDTRSSLYCTDVARMIGAPVFHVNADDPEAVVLAMQVALEFRMAFHMDVVVDLVCFRRLGHNEADEPAVTQPLMYKKISQHPGAPALYAARLAREGVVPADVAAQMTATYRAALEQGEPVAHALQPVNFRRRDVVDWSQYTGSATGTVETGVSLSELQRLAGLMTTVPAQFKLHARVEQIIAHRRDMGNGTRPVDWGFAENMAYATLLVAGHGVRVSGQDSGRGTFFHRHAVLHDQNRERRDAGTWVPLQHLDAHQPPFEIIDSFLSEEAVLGFEYGYAISDPDSLVVWEAQYGDFANGAQVVIDQFITSGEAKWGRRCHLVLMLPHGYEGQGPEHSSARLERYLQLCADDNIRVCVPTLPAQMFHLLRQQVLGVQRRPLVVLSPKSLLRHPDSVSALEDLAADRFMPVIGETGDVRAAAVRRVVLCSGKIYFELMAARRKTAREDVAIVRIEQLYPFPGAALTEVIGQYRRARDVVWAQEEPRNQGAWLQIEQQLRDCLRPGQKLSYAGRPPSAAPAVGYAAKHMQQQQQLVQVALGLGPAPSMEIDNAS